MSGPHLQLEFLEVESRRILVLMRRPVGPCVGCVLMVPAFAEEMNKSRRMTALTAQALAQRGMASVTLDLYGTGDSEGELDDASWERWVADVIRVRDWVADQGFSVTGMLGNRLGCALGAQAMRQCGTVLTSAVFWQPVIDGPRFMDQFLRLRVAATLMSEDGKESVSDLRKRLRSGETIEVAGYPLTNRLIASIDQVRLGAGGVARRLHWMEVTRSLDAGLPTPTSNAIEGLRGEGAEVTAHQILGEPYWSSTEIVVLPELIERTLTVFAEDM